MTKNETLDHKHKEYNSTFEKNKNNFQNLLKKKEKLEKDIEKLNKMDLRNYNSDILAKKAKLLDDKKILENKLKNIQNNVEESIYYNNTIDYLVSYYDKSNKCEKKTKNILDFFKKKGKKVNENSKSSIFKKYMSVTDNVIKNKKKISKFAAKCCKNPKCNNQELILHLSDGYLICKSCGECHEILLDSDKPKYKDIIPDASAYAYKRINHLNEWLAQFQAKESTDISDDIYDKILIEVKKERLVGKRITPKKMRQILKKLGLNKYYEHTQHIINKITGIPPPKITREVEEKLRWMFKEMQEPFALYCPKHRKNFLNYAYTLHKCCELLELDDFLECFPLLKSPEKLKEQDIIWEKICKHLKWEFIPSDK